MNGKPTAKQKRFHEWCRERGCVLTVNSNPDIHHIKGSKMKLKGVSGYAGEWFVIPVISEWHNYYGKPLAIHADRKGFNKFWNTTEKELWADLMSEYLDQFGEYPMSEDEYFIMLKRA